MEGIGKLVNFISSRCKVGLEFLKLGVSGRMEGNWQIISQFADLPDEKVRKLLLKTAYVC